MTTNAKKTSKTKNAKKSENSKATKTKTNTTKAVNDNNKIIITAETENPVIVSENSNTNNLDNNFTIVRCKREDYIKAWNYMYKYNKKSINENKLYDDINPALNKKPLTTETDNFCVVAFDSNIKTEEFEYGTPVGIFSFVVTPSKVIGKQFLVIPDYLHKGLGKALLIENEKTLIENGFEKYYIGCSQCSAGIYKKYWNIEPYSSDVEGDLYKFNIDLKRNNFEELYSNIMKDIKVIK